MQLVRYRDRSGNVSFGRRQDGGRTTHSRNDRDSAQAAWRIFPILKVPDKRSSTDFTDFYRRVQSTRRFNLRKSGILPRTKGCSHGWQGNTTDKGQTEKTERNLSGIE